MIGILGLQGDFAAHGRMLDRLQTKWQLVKSPTQLEQIDGLIIPGGESTTLLKLIDQYNFTTSIYAFHAAGGSLFGTCAGLIVLAAEVTNPPQASLGLIDVSVERNAYGRQIHSSESTGTCVLDEQTDKLPMVFIRAPRICSIQSGVMCLAKHNEEVVLVRQNRILAATFHPELTDDTRVHQYFLNMTRSVNHSEGVNL